MRQRLKAGLLLFLVEVLPGCGGPSTTLVDAGALDAAAPMDMSASSSDLSGLVDDILGTLMDGCPTLIAELASPSPSTIHNALVFVNGDEYSRSALSPGGMRLYDTPNAGGSSGESEVMSFEVLHACAGALLEKTETEIQYAPPTDGGAGSNAITDILLRFGGDKVGVSVTRAYKPGATGMNDSEILDLLEKKLGGINRSTMRVLPADQWTKQILHVFVATFDAEAAVTRVLATVDAPTRADTIVVVTRTTGGGFIYCDPDPALGAECP